MKNNITFKGFGFILNGITKKAIHDKTICKNILKEYRGILDRAKDIGSQNVLCSSYALAAYFIAMNRQDHLSPEENIEILDQGLRKSKMTLMFLGNADSYLDPKRLKKRQEWSKQTHQHRYENDWVVDVLSPNGEYDLGYDYLECGVCKLCRDEGCFELAKYLCRLDFMLVEVIGIRLERTMTLADGCEKCDFRFHRS